MVLTFLPGYANAYGIGEIRLSYIDGDVQINSESTRDWVLASSNMPLAEGDRIWVPDDGRAEMHFRKGTVVRLKEKTSSDILTYDRDSLQLYLNIGSIYVNFRGMRDTILQINTPVASIRAYNDTILKVEVLNNGYTYVSVYRGSVYTDYRDGRNTITEGTMLLIKGYSREEAIPLSSPDSWVRWNMDRDRRIYGGYKSSQYLPEELNYYSYDFDANGRWVNVRDYGYCWQPTVMVSAGWAPYRHGRWAWNRGDYVWISYEPWGWAPYHYGRWAFSASIGWFWVPPARGSVYWGPGYVGWIQTPNYISWVPLAPRETYYGYGNYGPYSVNLINVNINKIIIKDKYKNARVRDGFTVVHRDTFVTGKPADIRIRENPFEREKIRPGRPDISPERRSAMPIIRDVPERKLPPSNIKEIQVRELKERAPMQKQRDSQMQDRLKAPQAQPDGRRDQIQRDILPQDRKMDRNDRILPTDRKPDIQDRRVPDDRIKDRAPADIRKDNLNQAPIQAPKPRKEDVREIIPQDVKPDKGRQVVPPQDRKPEIQENIRKQQEKDSHDAKKPVTEEEHLRDRGLTPPRHR